MGSIIRFPFVGADGRVDFPAVLGFVVAVAGAVFVAKKLPLLKRAV